MPFHFQCAFFQCTVLSLNLEIMTGTWRIDSWTVPPLHCFGSREEKQSLSHLLEGLVIVQSQLRTSYVSLISPTSPIKAGKVQLSNQWSDIAPYTTAVVSLQGRY